MTNEIYSAFVEAGLEREARKLSTTITDSKGNNKVIPAIGHYISAVDNILELEKQFPDRAPDTERTKFYSVCVKKILDYACQDNMNKSPIKMPKLLDSLNQIFCRGKIN